jgi:hypothetical protein
MKGGFMFLMNLIPTLPIWESLKSLMGMMYPSEYWRALSPPKKGSSKILVRLYILVYRYLRPGMIYYGHLIGV